MPKKTFRVGGRTRMGKDVLKSQRVKEHQLFGKTVYQIREIESVSPAPIREASEEQSSVTGGVDPISKVLGGRYAKDRKQVREYGP